MSEATEWDPEFYLAHAPRPVSAYDQKGIEIYSAQLDAARDIAEHNPLAAGQSYPVTLTIPHSNPRPGARAVPFVPQSPCVSLRLDEPLQTGAGKFSQVWTAVVEGTGTKLVMKIIQPSMCPRPPIDRSWVMYHVPEDLARREAWAYERIAHKQGILVPYFLGLDKITTPSGEPAWVLVLEYIPSVTFASLLDSPSRSFSDICDVTKLSIDAAENFTSDGWVHVDLAARNILVTGSPGTRGVVFIDHFACRFASSDMEDVYVGRDLYLHIRQCSKFDLDFQRWAKANIGTVAAVPILEGQYQ
ncbi:hypothetical protein DFH06DRAFT_1050196 [Mycena polygramma]|nr:hypothetical protein DFH06DRAFT_1050196 [Mycena polygramma]